MRLFQDNKHKDSWSAFRYIVFCMIAALTVAVFFEFAFNYKAIRNGYVPQKLQISQKVENGKLKIKTELPENIYVSKLQLHGAFQKNLNYNVKITYINEFGQEESEKIRDKAYSYFSDAWSPINRELTKMEISFSNGEQAKISEVWVHYKPAVNWYRVAFVMLTVFIALMIFGKRKIFVQKLEYLFIVYSLGFGMLMIAAAGPKYMTWDETVHYTNVYTICYGDTEEWNKASRANWQGQLPDVNTLEELELLKTYANQQSEEMVSKEVESNSFLRSGQYIYLPMVIFYQLGRLLPLSFSNLFMMGRIGNLLACVLMGFLSVKLEKHRKILVTAILMFPTVLFQECMYTYDGMIVGCVVLGCVLWMNEINRGDRSINKGKVVLGGLLFLMSSLIKPVYLPLLLLFLALPNGKLRINKRFCVIIGGIIALTGMVLAVFLFPSIRAAIGGDLNYGADVRGGDTGIVAQCLSMIRHPLSSITMFIREMLTMDNFRNLALSGMDDYLPTNLMLLNLANFGSIKDEWSLLLIPLLLLLFLVSPQKPQFSCKSRRIRTALLLAVSACVLAIWGAMYLTFTPVGHSGINGVQARYFIPLMLPVGYLLWNDRIEIKIKETTFTQIILGTVLLLMGQCIYQLVILKRCI